MINESKIRIIGVEAMIKALPS